MSRGKPASNGRTLRCEARWHGAENPPAIHQILEKRPSQPYPQNHIVCRECSERIIANAPLYGYELEIRDI